MSDARRTPVIEKEFAVEKVDAEHGIVYGFAIVSTVDGRPYWDLQGDHIPEDVMAKAADEFSSLRVGSDQHTGEHVGDIVFALPILTGGPVTYRNAAGVAKTGLYIGYKPQDPVHLDMIASGERTGFSIGGALLDYHEGEIGKSVWSTATVDGFPDSSFLYVKAGGKKDVDGKTTPRSNRMFPVKDDSGKVDLPHLRNALARIPQASLPADVKGKLTDKAKAMLASSEKSVGKAYDGDAKKRGRVFRSFKLHEISLVTRPAQEGATIDVVKNVIARVKKDVCLTSSDDGHQHVVYLEDLGDDSYACTSSEFSSDADLNNGSTHYHKVTYEDGKIVIADNAGHGHSASPPADWTPPIEPELESTGLPGVEVVALAAPEVKPDLRAEKDGHTVVVTDPQETIKMTDAEIAALTAERDRYKKMAELSDAHRAYHGRLDAASGTSFLAKSVADRELEVSGSILGKTADGTTYYRGQEQLFALAKGNDELSAKLAAQALVLKRTQTVAKAAETLGEMAGTEATAVAIVEAIETIPDEATRKAAFEMLKGANAAIEMLSKAAGHAIVKDAGEVNAEDAFYKGVVEHATETKMPLSNDVEMARATIAFQQTAKGAALYKAYVEAKPATLAR